MCESENAWLACYHGTHRQQLWEIYVKKRKIFDREKQRSKRQFWKNEQDKRLDMCKTDPNKFSKTIGKIGIHDDGKPDISMEVYDESGNIVGDTKFVLKKWWNEFE